MQLSDYLDFPGQHIAQSIESYSILGNNLTLYNGGGLDLQH